jgi:hypothetical protein
MTASLPNDRLATALPDPGVEGNRRLTALTGVVQLVALTAVVLSGLIFGTAPWLHYFLGFLALPLTVLKLASTGWRFLHYYAVRSPAYRTAGPPTPLPRLLAPLLVASTLAAFVTGVVLFFQGQRRGTVATLHTDSAVVFVVAALLHVAVHLRTTLDASADLSASTARVPGGAWRRGLVAGATLAGLVVAIALVAGYHWSLAPEHLRFER